MLDMFQLVNTLANAHLAIDYPKNTEYHQFGALKDVWIYFIHRLEEEPVETDSTPSSGMGVILPFKPKS
jgi:hypothetical protein